MNPWSVLKRPTAFLPVAMSLGALATVLGFLAFHGPAPQALPIVALQVGAALAAMAPVFWLRW